MALRDEHGQPVNTALNLSRRQARTTDETLGLLRGILADDHVSDPEVLQLARWLYQNAEHTALWPFNVLTDRIYSVLKDGQVDEEERSDLHRLIEDILGTAGGPSTEERATIHFTEPPPDVIFDQNVFVLTGRFAYGTRRKCQSEIELRGGRCSETVTLQTTYLVVGTYSSRDWLHSNFGLKIEKAVEYSRRCDLAILSEEHWASFLFEPK